MGQVGRDFSFQSCFSFLSFSKNKPAVLYFSGGSNIRVLEARGLAGLARRLAGVAGRRIGTT